MPEMLDIVDENGVPTGQSVPRTTAHAEGLRHRTSHVWIVRRKNGRVQVLLQMRCAAKDSYPGCYDISSAGHIPAGAEFVGSALRELREELELGGAIFHTTSDTEVIAYIITQERLRCDSIEQAVLRAMERIEGAYSLVIMSPQKLIAARDPHGFRPLCIGQLGNSTIFASESCALDAVAAGLCVVDAGHFDTEKACCEVWRQTLQTKFDALQYSVRLYTAQNSVDVFKQV